MVKIHKLFFCDDSIQFEGTVKFYHGNNHAKPLATLEQYQNASRDIGTVFEALEPGELIQLADGIYELDDEVDPITVLVDEVFEGETNFPLVYIQEEPYFAYTQNEVDLILVSKDTMRVPTHDNIFTKVFSLKPFKGNQTFFVNLA